MRAVDTGNRFVSFMKITDWDSVNRPDEKVCLAVGNFDGLHIGHCSLLKRLVENCACALPAVLTFDPHPKKMFGDGTFKSLMPLPEKARQMHLLSVSEIFVLCRPAYYEMTPDRFIDDICRKIDLKRLIVGRNFHFGKDRAGNLENLRILAEKKGFILETADLLSMDGMVVSSTAIRDLIGRGNMQEAAKLLGRYYRFSGRVVHGNKTGRKLGYPTANLDTGDYVIPGEGVYAVSARRGNIEYAGVMSIGRRETLTQRGRITVEVHLLDQNLEIYDELLDICVQKKLRNQKKFDNIQILIKTIGTDIMEVRKQCQLKKI